MPASTGIEKEQSMFRYLGDKVVLVNCTPESLQRKKDEDGVITVQYRELLFTVKARALTEEPCSK